MKILIVEDELALVESISTYLVEERYSCEHAMNYQQAEGKVLAHEYDCVLLNPAIPGGHGMEMLKLLQERNRQDGLIIISADCVYEHKIDALRSGADDYVCKPFQLPELEARIFSVIRRRQFRNHNIIQLNEIKIDLVTKTVWVRESPVSLTKKNSSCCITSSATATALCLKPRWRNIFPAILPACWTVMVLYIPTSRT